MNIFIVDKKVRFLNANNIKIMNLPIVDLYTSNDFVLNSGPFITILIFSLKSLKILLNFSKDFNNEGSAVYIGRQKMTLISWIEKRQNLCSIGYGGDNIDKWARFRVIGKPWVLVFRDNEILLSIDATKIPLPLRKNIMKSLRSSGEAIEETVVKRRLSNNSIKDTNISTEEKKKGDRVLGC